MKPKSLRNIRRMDDDARSTHAWLVQVQRHNQTAMKMFSDGVWGGKQMAIAARAQGVSDAQTAKAGVGVG